VRGRRCKSSLPNGPRAKATQGGTAARTERRRERAGHIAAGSAQLRSLQRRVQRWTLVAIIAVQLPFTNDGLSKKWLDLYRAEGEEE